MNSIKYPGNVRPGNAELVSYLLLAESRVVFGILPYLIITLGFAKGIIFWHYSSSPWLLPRLYNLIAPAKKNQPLRRIIGINTAFIATSGKSALAYEAVSTSQRSPAFAPRTMMAEIKNPNLFCHGFIYLPPKLSTNIIAPVCRFVNRIDNYFNNIYENFISPSPVKAKEVKAMILKRMGKPSDFDLVASKC